MSKCEDNNCQVIRDDGELYCFIHGTVSFTYKPGDKTNMEPKDLRFRIRAKELIGNIEYMKRNTLMNNYEIAQALGIDDDTYYTVVKKYGKKTKDDVHNS